MMSPSTLPSAQNFKPSAWTGRLGAGYRLCRPLTSRMVKLQGKWCSPILICAMCILPRIFPVPTPGEGKKQSMFDIENKMTTPHRIHSNTVKQQCCFESKRHLVNCVSIDKGTGGRSRNHKGRRQTTRKRVKCAKTDPTKTEQQRYLCDFGKIK